LLKNNIHRVFTVDEAKKKAGIIELPWCGKEECALEIEAMLEGNTLGVPLTDTDCNKVCPICNKNSVSLMRYAKTY